MAEEGSGNQRARKENFTANELEILIKKAEQKIEHYKCKGW
jgi:hypothetical protein